jgi:hypothetical protein
VAKSEPITSTQIRAARGFLAWDRRDLAKKSVITLYTIECLETALRHQAQPWPRGWLSLRPHWSQRASRS